MIKHTFSKDKEGELGLKRTNRNNWIEQHEDTFMSLAPYPISYDVGATQKTNFSEFTYTEYLGGIYLKTQSQEINMRIINAASKIKADKDYLSLIELDNKYIQDDLNINDLPIIPKKVAFFTGDNLIQMVSKEQVARLAFYNDDFAVKFHPLTSEKTVEDFAKIIGWNRIIPPAVSAKPFIDNAEDIYATTATELAAVAVIKNKNLFDITDFFLQHLGAYIAINTLLFRETSKQKRYELLNNIVACKWSGIIMPFQDDYFERATAFYKKSLEFRDIYKPLTNQFTQGAKYVVCKNNK